MLGKGDTIIGQFIEKGFISGIGLRETLRVFGPESVILKFQVHDPVFLGI